MGSDSDWPVVGQAADTLRQFAIPFEVRVISAHRTPEKAAAYAATAAERGLKVIIAAAGGAAHLAGVLAAGTTLPVLGVPVAGGALNGMDALLATVQMPAGVPVGTLALGSAGPINAALLTTQILALSDSALRERFHAHKERLKEKVTAADSRLAASLATGAPS